MSTESKLYPLVKPVLTHEQRLAVMIMAAYWREVMDRDDRGPLHYELTRLLRAIGFPAAMELIARSVQAEADNDGRCGLRDVDWLMAAAEEEGDTAAERIYNRACSIAGVNPTKEATIDGRL